MKSMSLELGHYNIDTLKDTMNSRKKEFNLKNSLG